MPSKRMPRGLLTLLRMLVVLGLLGGCSDGGGGDKRDGEGSGGTTARGTGDTVVANAVCEDLGGDLYETDPDGLQFSEPASADLLGATADLTSKQLKVSFTTVKPIDTDDLPVFVVLADASGSVTGFDLRISGGKDGWAITRATYTDGPAKYAPLDGEVSVVGNKLTAVVDVAYLPPIGELLRLNYAAESLTADGKKRTDECFDPALR